MPLTPIHLTHKFYTVCLLFALSLISFTVQTELTSHLSVTLNFNQPYLLLYLTHSSWVLLWPLSVIFNKTVFGTSYSQQFSHILQLLSHANKYLTLSPSGTENLKRHAKHAFYVCSILNVAAVTWYVSMSYSPATDITAIYNSSAFFALLFAIPILHDPAHPLKFISCLVAIFGVVITTYTPSVDTEYPQRFTGNVIIAVGAVLYGLYEVMYKKWLCPAESLHLSYFNMCFLGGYTLLTMWPTLFIPCKGVTPFEVEISGEVWRSIIVSIVANQIFSLSFAGMMIYCGPVVSSVSSLLTIVVVGLTELLLYGVGLSFRQVLGDLLIGGGFVVLAACYWTEMTEEESDGDSCGSLVV